MIKRSGKEEWVVEEKETNIKRKLIIPKNDNWNIGKDEKEYYLAALERNSTFDSSIVLREKLQYNEISKEN